MAKKHGKNCNLYRLQDVYMYLYDPPRMAKSEKRHAAIALQGARAALRSACVSIPRSVKTPAQLWALAKKVGDAHGFDAHAGEYRKR